MTLNRTDLSRFIARQGIEADLVELRQETLTVESAAEAVNQPPDAIGKSILFFADGLPMLVIANGTSRVDYKMLARHLAISRKKLRLANAEQVLTVTGYEVGTVPPFGHKKRLRTLVEDRVLRQGHIYVGGGAINTLLRISTDELVKVTGAEIVSL